MEQECQELRMPLDHSMKLSILYFYQTALIVKYSTT